MGLLKINAANMVKIDETAARNHALYGMEGGYLAVFCLIAFSAILALLDILYSLLTGFNLLEITLSFLLTALLCLCTFFMWKKHARTIGTLVFLMGVLPAILLVLFLPMTFLLDNPERFLLLGLVAILAIEVGIAYWVRKSVRFNVTTRHLVYPSDPAAQKIPNA